MTVVKKIPDSFALTLNEADLAPLSPPVYAHVCKYSTYSNIRNQALCEAHGLTMLVLRVNLLLLKLFVKLCVF